MEERRNFREVEDRQAKRKDGKDNDFWGFLLKTILITGVEVVVLFVIVVALWIYLESGQGDF